MKKTLLSLALASLASVANAGAYIIDDFGTGDQSLTNTALGTVTDSNAVRTISSTLLTALPPIQNSTTVSFGILDITNGGGEDSSVQVTWNIAPLTVPAGATDISFLFSVIQSDGNPTDVSFNLNGSSIFATAIPSNTTMSDVTFVIDPALISAGGSLELTINGAPGWDLTLDAFGISWTDPTTPTPVPEPTSMALIGLGALGLAAARRRK